MPLTISPAPQAITFGPLASHIRKRGLPSQRLCLLHIACELQRFGTMRYRPTRQHRARCRCGPLHDHGVAERQRQLQRRCSSAAELHYRAGEPGDHIWPPAQPSSGRRPFTVSASGGGSGNPVTFSAGPATVCMSSGANGATITLADTGTCTVTAQQAGNANYSAAAAVAQGFTVAYPPLYLVMAVTTSPPGTVTTGSTVTDSFTLG